DEPLSNLDASLRAHMRIELTDLHRALGATMIYVTHDQVEAMTKADKILVLNGGQIEQVGTPMELYNAPVSPFVAGFIGSPKMNLYDGKAAGENCATFGIRPEHLRLTEDAPRWTGIVRHVERLGADTVIYLNVPDLGEMVVRADGDTNPAIGARQGVSPVPGRAFHYGQRASSGAD
ncbi:MAG: TOBE domain-containing protein, partial [Candidatus Saccharibacteria bacterium]|nr:TOBE domain-containing protein [Pseudorhodobacter sp.]